MQIECAKCNSTILYQDSAPKFCSECGASLSEVSSIEEDVTIARTPGSSASTSDTQDFTHPVSPQDIEKFNLETVGPYRLIRKLGQGGMGTVFEASHIESGRNVALKLLSPEVRGTDEMVQRFRRESQIAASINHPRSTFVYEADEHDGQLYITMELMGGGTLKDVVAKEGPLPVGRAVDYVIDIIDGLLVAHNAGIVHRDLKPSNSFVDHDGRIKVGDFGLAKSFLGDSSLTQTGTFMGTPQYAAPEQIRNDDVDERTDIYALGGTLFYLLTGRAPFTGNPAQVISAIASQTPPKMSEVDKGLPKPLVKLVAQTLEKDPGRRPFNLNVVRDQLLPFSTRGAMAADPGRRMGAYYLDSILMGVISWVLITIFSPVLVLIFATFSLTPNPQVAGVFIYTILIVLYFAICESCWGRTIGKWLFGLRVVDKNLESPGFMTALVRAALIPGLLIGIEQFMNLWYLHGLDPSQIREMMTQSLRGSLISQVIEWSVLFALIFSARKENGYRAFHDWLTGTRIVRLSGNLESKLLDRSPVTVPVAPQESQSVGQYELLGCYQTGNHGISSSLGLDHKLDRPVWLFQGFKEDPITEERRHLTRPSRLRIIDESQDEKGFWYSSESVPGVPLIHAIKTGDCPWTSICPLFRDIAYELALSEENQIIPDNMSVSNFWMDHTGRIRILDHSLIAVGQDSNGKSASNSSSRLAVNALIELLDSYREHHDHPVALIEIIQKLRAHVEVGMDPLPDGSSIFDWAVGEFNELIERQASWNLIDRAGMLTISMGIEFAIFTSALFMLGFFFSWLPLLWQALIAGVASLSILAGLAYFMDGGVAMRLAGVSLRSARDNERASPLRNLIRSIIAWLPISCFMTLVLALLYAMKNSDKDLLATEAMTILPLSLIAIFSLMIAFAGCFFAIISPRRSLPDLLLGTRLMRK